MTTNPLDLPSARQFRDELTTLLRREQASMADFLVALADFDRRRGWEPLGHASLFAFLHVELRLSKGAAFWRLSAARLLQRFPDAIEPLRDGRLCLSTTAELAKVLTEENLAAVLPRYFGLSAREASGVTAELVPREEPPLRTVVTVPERERRYEVMAAPILPGPPVEATRTLGAVLTSEPTTAHPVRVEPRHDIEPLTAELRRLHITVDREFLKMLDAARDGLSHAIPGASTEQVLKAALELLLEKQARARGEVKRARKVAPTVAPTAASTPLPCGAPSATPPPTARPTSPATEPHHRRTGPRETIPAAVRRAVWERDQGRCVWPLDGGGTCGSTHRLELDHIEPWARFSEPTVDNLRVVCHAHNALAARQAFGERYMARYAGRAATG